MPQIGRRTQFTLMFAVASIAIVVAIAVHATAPGRARVLRWPVAVASTPSAAPAAATTLRPVAPSAAAQSPAATANLWERLDRDTATTTRKQMDLVTELQAAIRREIERAAAHSQPGAH